MWKRFINAKSVLSWVVLFLVTIALSIMVAEILDRPNLSFPASIAQPSPSTQVSSTSLELQSKYNRSLAHYATVDRSDGSFRQMYIDEVSMAAIKPEQALQDGTLPNGTLIVMETWYSPEDVGTVFVKQKQNGEWQYGSFSPDQPNYQMRFSGSCHSCHAPFSNIDFTLTKPLLEEALRTRQVQNARCDRPGRTPCSPDTYLPNAS